MLRKAIHTFIAAPLMLVAVLAANGPAVFVHRCHCHDAGIYVSLVQQRCGELHHESHGHGHCHHEGCSHSHAPCSEACTHGHAHSVEGGPLLDITAETECCGCEDERIAIKLLYVPTDSQHTVQLHDACQPMTLVLWALAGLHGTAVLHSEAKGPPPAPPMLRRPQQLLACARSALAPTSTDDFHLL